MSDPIKAAQLKFFGRGTSLEHVSLIKEEPFNIGRSSGNDYVICNPYVSATHCRLDTGVKGTVFITNLSQSNPIFINRYHPSKRLLHGEHAVLNNGDTVYLTPKSEKGCYFTFHPAVEELDETQRFSLSGGSQDLDGNDSGIDRAVDSVTPPVDQVPVNADEVIVPQQFGVADATQPFDSVDPLDEFEEPPQQKRPRVARVRDQMARQNEAAPDDSATNRSPASDVPVSRAPTVTHPDSRQTSVTSVAPSTVSTELSTTDDKVEASAEDAAGPSNTTAKLDPMMEQMQCPICMEVIHQAVSVQPCLHKFCGGCYSGSHLLQLCVNRGGRLCANGDSPQTDCP